jgi:acylphosphatase
MRADEVSRAVRITGRVQGVGFRWWTRQTAEQVGVRGTVRNAVDGSVEVRFAGPPDAVDRFMDALRAGPPYARVDRLEETTPPGDDLPASFQIIP